MRTADCFDNIPLSDVMTHLHPLPTCEDGDNFFHAILLGTLGVHDHGGVRDTDRYFPPHKYCTARVHSATWGAFRPALVRGVGTCVSQLTPQQS